MKKLLLLVMVLGIAAPSMAAVTLTGTATELTATIGCTWDSAAERPRAFALTLDTQSALVTITAVGGFKTGVSQAQGGTRGYGIFPGSIKISNGAVTDFCTPVESASSPGAAGTGIGQQKVIVVLGSLYDSGNNDENAPISGGVLFTVTASASCTLKITPESMYRGGVVDELGASIAIANAQNQLLVTLGTDCITLATVGQTVYDMWVSVGKPNCWCYAWQCKGDADGLTEGSAKTGGVYHVGANDLNVLTAGWKKLDSDPAFATFICADFDHQTEGSAKTGGVYHVGANDLNIMIANWKSTTVAGNCGGTLVP